MSKKTKVILIIAGVLVFIAGIAVYTKVITENAKQEGVAQAEEKSRIKAECLNYLTEEHTSEEIEAYLLERFPKMDRTDCTSVVDMYIYGVYQHAMQHDLTDDQTNMLYAAMVSDGLFDLALITDESFGQQVADLSSMHVVPRYVNEALFFDVDYGYFSKIFGDYVNPDYKTMLDFFDNEKIESYSKPSENILYTDIVEGRLDELYSLMAQYPDSEIYDSFEDQYDFYTAVYLGAYGQEYVFDKTGSILRPVYDAYVDYKDKTNDKELKALLGELVSSYTENDLVRTIPTYEKIRQYVGITQTEETTAAAE